MPSQNALFHAYLRPAMLQILRATGYHSTSPAVLDCVTDLAARYLFLLCERTAEHAARVGPGDGGQTGDFGVPEVRLALRDAGALLPERIDVEQLWREEEDMRGVEDFVKWASGSRAREILEYAKGDGELDEVDYLAGLKKRHNMTSDDSKFQGTILGKPNDATEIEVEGGGGLKSIYDWILQCSSSSSSSTAVKSASPAKPNGISQSGEASPMTRSPRRNGDGERHEETALPRGEEEMELC